MRTFLNAVSFSADSVSILEFLPLVVPLKPRMTTLQELLRLQGVSPDRIKVPKNVSQRQMRQMIGNAFSVNVFARVFLRLLTAVNFRMPKSDPYERGLRIACDGPEGMSTGRAL